jgi:putative ABC transport system permease protein
MHSLRWKKVLRDLWVNRSRSLLAVLAMTIGIIGVSAVLCAYSILVRELDANYMRTNPASAAIVTEGVSEELARALQRFPGIASVETRGFFPARIAVGENEWKTLHLFVIADFSAMRIGKSEPEEGRWPPRTGDILIERAAMRVIKNQMGDHVVVRLLLKHRHGWKVWPTDISPVIR